MSGTRVVNIRSGEPYDVYIGRATWSRRLAQSKWCNPYRVGRDGSREDVIERYRRRLLGDPVLLAQIGDLRGKVLACWCKPAACHGDVLAALADRADPEPLCHGCGHPTRAHTEMSGCEAGEPICWCYVTPAFAAARLAETGSEGERW